MELDDEDVRRERTKNTLLLIKKLKARVEELERGRGAAEPVAIIGLSCRFPGAPDPEALWRLLSKGVDAIGEVPPDRWDKDSFYDPDPDAPGKMWSRAGGFLEDVDRFDPAFFGIAPREVLSMDPQHRLLLEVSWEALERAGIAPLSLLGSRTGVFAGICANDYAQILAANGAEHLDTYFSIGNALSAAVGRVSYVLGLQGPAVALDTACSSSLVALHQAAKSLLDGEIDLALAGGVNLVLSPVINVNLTKARMLSPDGRCKTFDASANGYVRGEGCGVVVLKRLRDAARDGDQVLAVIRGSAVNQDGRSAGLTVPNGPSQEAVIREALQRAGASPGEIGYVEAHGTGTSLGDPIEVRALAAALGQGRPEAEPLLIGSIKTNIGHLEAAAGIAGVIKVALSLQHGLIPPHLHFREPSAHIPWADIAVRVNTAARPWPANRPLAGVSSFGFIGTNAHVVLEGPGQGPPPDAAAPAPPKGRSAHLLTLSARTRPALEALADRHARWLADHPEAALADVAFTANTGRSHFAFRAAVVAGSREEARSRLATLASGAAEETPGLWHGEAPPSAPKLAFLFSAASAEGAQRASVARELHDTEPVFREVLDRCNPWAQETLGRPLTEALFEREGRTPRTADTLPALLALEVALAALWQSWGITPDVVLGHGVGALAAAVVAGAMRLEDGLRLAPALLDATPDDPERLARALELQEPRVPLVSCVTGRRLGPGEALDAASFLRHARAPARFADGVGELAAMGVDALLEIGPSSALLERARSAWPEGRGDPICVPSLRPGASDVRELGAALARLYVRGASPDFKGLDRPFPRRRLVLPTYPFQRRRCSPDRAPERPRAPAPAPAPRSLLGARTVSAASGEIVHEIALGLDAQPFLGDHRIFGGVVVPGATYPAMALCAAGTPSRLTHVLFLEPLFLDEGGSRPVQLVLSPPSDSGRRDVHVYSASGGAWVRHAAAVLEPAGAPGADDARDPLDVEAVQRRLRERSPEELYDRYAVRGITLGPRFRGIHRLWSGPGEALAEILTPATLERSVDDGPVHPAVLDACTGAAGAVVSEASGAEALYVPFQYEEIELRAPLPARFFCHARLREIDPTNAEAGVFDLALVDAEGRPLGAVRGFVVKRASQQAFTPSARFDAGGWLYELCWQERARPASTEARLPGRWLVLGDAGGLGGRVAARCEAPVIVELGAAFQALGGDRYRLPADDPAGHERLLAELSGAGIEGVLHALGLEGGEGDAATTGTFDAEVSRGCASALSLVQALARRGARPPAGLWIVTRGALVTGVEERTSLTQAPLVGLARVIALEHPDLGCRLLDLDPARAINDDDDGAVGDLIAVLRAPLDEDQLALRGHALRVPRLSRLRRAANSPPTPALALQRDASYLITGGLGGLGLEVARWMVARGARHLALLGRRPPGPSEEAALHALREAGCEVLTLTADVSRAPDVVRALAAIDAALPPLKGILHAAGVLDDGVLRNQRWDRFEAVFAPKIAGARHLHELTVDRALDVFVLFSSTAALLGSPGQGNYAAANAFLDALAHHRRRAGLPALSINWGGWAETGMAARAGLEGRLGAQGVGMIGTEQGLATLERLLSLGVAQAAVLPIDWPAFRRQLHGAAGPPLLQALLAEAAPADPAPPPAGVRRRLEEAAPEDRPGILRTYLEEELTEVLRLDRSEAPDPEEDFFDMGMDSLTAVELRNRLRRELDPPATGAAASALSPAVIFENRSIARLVTHLSSKLGLARTGGADEAPRATDWSAEATLPPDLGAPAGLREAARKPATILLTGASGFLGAFLLHELLTQTEARVVCLVRCADPAAGLERIRQNQALYGLADERLEVRVAVLPGDLAAPRLGLDPAAYERLAEQVDLILHNGALVNFLHPYDWLKTANVLGTLEILRLACYRTCKPVHHISTVAAFSAGRGRINEDDVPSDLGALGLYGGIALAVGYSQSKAVAELLVRAAGARGVPVTIHRPGFISGSSVNGAWSRQDITARLFKSWVEFGCCFLESIDLAPADYVSKAIVHLVTRGDTSGKTFHLTNPRSITGAELVELCGAIGIPLARVAYGEFRAELEARTRRTGDEALAGLLEVMPAEEISVFRRPLEVDCRRTQELLAESPITCPPIDGPLLGRYLRYFQQIGFIRAT